MRLIFGLDALKPPLTGIGYYAKHLAEAFLEADDLESFDGMMGGRHLARTEVAALLSSLAQDNSTSPAPQRVYVAALRRMLRRVPGTYGLRQLFRETLCKRALQSVGSTIYHEPNFIPCSFELPTVTTVHDLSYLRYPDFHPSERVVFLRRLLPRSLHRSAHVIVDAEATRLELIAEFGVPVDKISTVPLGVDADFYPRRSEQIAPHLDLYGVQQRQYFLSVGTIEPRKNLKRLLQAYSALPDHLRASFPLVLVGGKGWKDAAIHQQIRQIKSPGKIVVTGYLPRESLLALYAGALAFVYPSLYEGFGLPVLESMASGVPVVTSNVSSLPEVAGAAALLVDPESADEIAGAMQHLADDSNHAQRLSQSGLKRAKLFTWEQCAARTIRVYRQVLEA